MKKIILLLITGCLVTLAACNSANKKTSPVDEADAIYYGGDILTMEGDVATYADAVGVKDGKIVFVGSKEDAAKLKGDSSAIIDLQGKTMLPGFIDPHIHPSIAASILPMEIVSAMEWNTPV